MIVLLFLFLGFLLEYQKNAVMKYKLETQRPNKYEKRLSFYEKCPLW
jgi:hypothetical protein